ncbi:MAG TPA: 3'-5' exonuclease, partial [Patescibacteria group bacterium]|nr:3'-5' exonuclease [Patescibacteria group bacterium]
MSEPETEQLYCSVDLEFTGFDPSRDQILEIGFAFFKLTESGYEVVEEWSQVFKPSIDVHPKILGLTGITQEELDAAPEFSEHREFLQSKLGDAIIVGHNPVMDVKFLEGYGIKLSGQVIDTLELVQFILPTHHSYNLENLVHFFGVKHHKAHRALGDALSTILVLENLIRVYQKFSAELQKELATVLARGEFTWLELLNMKLIEKDIQNNDSLLHKDATKNLNPLILEDKLITIDSEAHDSEERIALGLKQKNISAVLVVPDSGTAMRLWQQEFAHGVFRNEDTFSKTAFEKFLHGAETLEELRFCLKIIVWLHTNWQTEVVFDLNISFFGGQFRQFIVGGKIEIAEQSIVVVDYVTLQSLVLAGTDFGNRELVICD